MILEKRKIHFYSAIALAIILPLVFIGGIVARPFYNAPNQSLVYGQFATEKTLNSTPATASKQLSASINRKDFPKVLSDQLTLDVALKSVGADSTSLIITPLSVFKFPDPLLYWQPRHQAPTEISAKTVLLGSLPGKASNINQRPRYIFDLPQQALKQDGSLVLYSQGYQAIAGVFPLCLSNTNQPLVCQEN